MIFTTYWFVLFAAVCFPIFWALRHPTLRLYFLLLACFVFHGHFAGAPGVLPIIALSIVTYAAGLSRNRIAIMAAIVLSVLALVFYKYTQFLSQQFVFFLSPAAAAHMSGQVASYLPAGPPLAVSFFTFEFIHYLYDVSKGNPSIRHPADFCAFTFFFPSLVAGPIKRYEQFLPSFHTGLKTVSARDVSGGMARVAVGFFKKVVIADNLTAMIAHKQPDFASLHIHERWLVFFAIALRIYFDFSGYSDLAIGFARMLGVRLPENFNWPYAARNLQDFWHRWHISLSTWIRDYVYIPLGGNRHGLARKALNAVIAFGLCGLWHGAAWSFAVWGIYHGVGLVVSSNYRALLGSRGDDLDRFLTRFPALVWLATFLFVCVGWLFFFYPLGEAFHMLGLLFSYN